MHPVIFSFALLVAAMLPGISLARGLGKVVTKATQKELGLDFELSATREPVAVLINMTIKRSGKLKDVRQVRLSIPAENQKDFLLLAPLAVREVGGELRVSAQLAPALAANASVDLVVEEGPREFFYQVKVVDYIIERKEATPKQVFDIRAIDGSIVISSDAIVGYEWATHTLVLKPGTRDRLRRELLGAGKPLTIPFSACLAGKSVYEGHFVSPASSRSSDKVSIVLDFDPNDQDRLQIQRGYAIDETKLGGKDLRSDEGIKKSLEVSGKLK
jgi:hypothetical protein